MYLLLNIKFDKINLEKEDIYGTRKKITSIKRIKS